MTSAYNTRLLYKFTGTIIYSVRHNTRLSDVARPTSARVICESFGDWRRHHSRGRGRGRPESQRWPDDLIIATGRRFCAIVERLHWQPLRAKAHLLTSKQGKAKRCSNTSGRGQKTSHSFRCIPSYIPASQQGNSDETEREEITFWKRSWGLWRPWNRCRGNCASSWLCVFALLSLYCCVFLVLLKQLLLLLLAMRGW